MTPSPQAELIAPSNTIPGPTITDYTERVPVCVSADVFPRLKVEEFAALREDIRVHGIRVPIVLEQQGALVDGQHRLQVAEELGIPCPTVTYIGHDEVGFMLSANLHRRQLTASQRAMVAAKLAFKSPGRPSTKTPSRDGVSTTTAAKTLQVSPSTVERAKKVLKHGSAEIVNAVETGAMPVGSAAALVTSGVTKSVPQKDPHQQHHQQGHEEGRRGHEDHGADDAREEVLGEDHDERSDAGGDDGRRQQDQPDAP